MKALPAGRRRLALALAAFLHSLAAVALLGQAYVTDDGILQVDIWLARALHGRVDASLTPAVETLTTLGSTTALALVAAAAGAYLVGRGQLREAALVAAALVGSQLLTGVLKASFQRPRPTFAEPVATADWFSFPSGHASSSIALYGALAFVLLRRSGRPRGIGVLGGLALLVAAIGFSRLYLGVHYLTDVIAGYGLGLAWLLLAIGATISLGMRDRPPDGRDGPSAVGHAARSQPAPAARARAGPAPLGEELVGLLDGDAGLLAERADRRRG